MLVLSRREQERIRFPSLGVSLELLRVRGKSAKIGIDAPPDTPVVRDELTSLKGIEFTPDQATTNEQLSRLVHAIRQRLDRACEELCQLHQHLEQTSDGAAEPYVLAIHRQLRELEREANVALENSPCDRSLRALVVDGDERERQVMETVLLAHQLDVTTATDGQDAWNHLSMHSAPDVILLDMEMPRGDGPSLLKQLRSQPELDDTKIFAFSAADPGSYDQALEQDAVDRWFAKPVNHDQLVSALIAQAGQPVTVA